MAQDRMIRRLLTHEGYMAEALKEAEKARKKLKHQLEQWWSGMA